MLIINRPTLNTNNDDDHYETLAETKQKLIRTVILSEHVISFQQSSILVQREDRGPCTHGTIIEKGDQNHNDPSHKMHMINTGCLITMNRKHIKVIPITLEQHLMNQISKDRKTDTLELIIRQFEDQTQCDKDLTLTEARQGTCAANMKGSM